MAHERVVAPGLEAVEVAVGAVVVAVRAPAVGVAVEELEAGEDVDEAVEVLGVEVQHVQPVGGVVAAGPGAVVVLPVAEQTPRVGATAAHVETLEPVDHVASVVELPLVEQANRFGDHVLR